VKPDAVVNFHVTERCNYGCTFCFGKWGLGAPTHELFEDVPLGRRLIEDVFRALRDRLNGERALRFNFVGGEPALLKSLPDLVEWSRRLGAKTSCVTNGLVFTRFTPEWVSVQFDLVGLSIDSASEATNMRIGRVSRSGDVGKLDHLMARVLEVRNLGDTIVKINTVVSSANHLEDLSEVIRALAPDKWKIFQMLPVYADSERVSEVQFHSFIDRHREFSNIITSEDNEQMTMSYLMVDPLGRFFWRDPLVEHGYVYSEAILDVGAAKALLQCGIEWDKFDMRYQDQPPDFS
jgi:radical S-adenosyl methionine domain-containing protein 2